MSVSNGPVQSGGAAVLGAAAVKGGSDALRGLPATGARVAFEVGSNLFSMVAAGAATAITALALIRGGGRSLEVSAGSDLDAGEQN